MRERLAVALSRFVAEQTPIARLDIERYLNDRSLTAAPHGDAA